MKRFYKFLMPLVAIVAMALPVNVMAQSLTVANGTATNTYVPIYGYYCDDDQHNQVVYPASMLADMENNYITSLSFYQQQAASESWGTTVTIKMMEITDSVLTDLVATTGATTVYTGTVNGTNAVETFVLTTPFEYQGGNLLVDITTTASTYSQNYWYGVTRTGSSVYVYGESPMSEIDDGYDGDVQSFLPKTTFTYNATGSVCYAPTAFASTESNGILTFTWTDNSATAWEFVYGADGFDPDNATDAESLSSTTTDLDLSQLADGMYDAYVRADCGGGEYSVWVGPVNFSVGMLVMNMATSGSDTLHTCAAIIYDNGGPTGSYSSGCDATLVVYPSDDLHALSISGSSYTESTYDYLRFYSGVGTSGEELWSDYGVDELQSFGPILSTTPITITFHSDGSVVRDGFQINVACVELPSCAKPEAFVYEGADSSSISFSWVDHEASAWAIGYGPAGFTLGDENTLWADFTDTVGVVTGLTPNTLYDFYLMAVCGADSSWTRSLTARTSCAPIHTLPWSEDFSTCPTGNSVKFDQCWDIYNNYSTSYNYPYVSNGYLYMYLYSSSSMNSMYGYAMLPVFDDDILMQDLEISFDIWGNSTSSYGRGVIVGLFDSVENNVPSIDTLAVIVPVATSQASAESHYISLVGRDLTGKRLGFFYQNQQPSATGSSYYTYIDNVNVHLAPSCMVPTDLTLNYAAPDTLDLSWNDPLNSGASYWVEYRPTGAADSVEWTGIEVSDTNIVLDGLSANTSYDIMVRALCGGSDTSFALTGTYRTACGPISVLPWIETFNSMSTTSSATTISCWDYIGAGGYVNITSSNSHTGNCVRFYPDGSSSTDHVLVLPEFDTPISDLQMSFWTCPEGSSSGSLSVGYVTNPASASSFVEVLNIPSSVGTTVAQYEVLFSGAPEGSRIAMRHNVGSTVWYWFVDDIDVHVAPDCNHPVALSVLGSTATEATIGWGGDEDRSFRVWFSAGSTCDTSTATYVDVDSTRYTFTGLTPSTTYTAVVATICDDGSLTSTLSVTFVTPEMGIDLPYATGFEATEDTAWVFVNGSQSNQWFIGSAAGNPGNGLYISSDNGASTNYNISSSSVVYAYRTFNFTAGQYAVSFDWKAQGESCCDYLRAYLVPASVTLTAGTLYSGIGSTGTPAGWIALDGDSKLNANNAWSTQQAVAIVSANSTYRLVFVWRNDGSVGTAPAAIVDNISIVQLTCPQPTALVADSTSTNSIDVSWTAGGSETQWKIRIDNGAWQTVNTTPSYQFTGLPSGTNHFIEVQAVCGDDDESFITSLSTATLCAAISDLPFTENFNSWGTGITPNCWSNAGSYSPASYGVISGSYNHSGSTGGSVYMYSSSTLSNKTYLTLPELDTLTYQPNQLQLVFSLFYTSSSYGRPAVEVGVMSDPANVSSFVVVDTVQHSGALSTWETFEVPMANYTGNGAYVAMRTAFDSAYSYFYLDDLTLEVIPTCPRPDSLTASNATTTTIDLGWHERSSASQWIVEYGPRGFELGTGTTVTANSNPFTLTGLPSSFQGEYYVKSICAVGDTSEYSRMACAFGTTQVPATLPYNYDFENAAEWQNWQTSTNHETNNWYRGTSVADSGSNAMYIAAGDTASYFNYAFNAVVNAAAYRDIDFGPVDSSYTLSFRARAGGTTTAAYDGLMVFLVDPSVATVASTQNITTPWGNVNDLYRIATVRLDTTWQTYEASFDTISGVHRVAFFWFNQNTGASYTNIPQPAAVDNIHIKYSTCPRPLNLEAVSTTSSTATLTWTGAAGADYEVVYRQVGGTNQTAIAHTNSITLTGLASTSEYRAWVRKICGAGDTSLYSDGTAFNTTMCDGAVTVATGDPSTATGTTYYAPVNNYYNYTLSETIIDSAELGGAMNITSLAYYYDYSDPSTAKNNVTIWLQPTTKSSFSGSSDIVALDTNTAVQVYSGNLNCSEGWNYFAFTTDFAYSGTGNVLVIVDDNSGDYDGSSYAFASQSTTDYKTIAYYSDSDNPDLNTISSSSSYSGTKAYYQYRPVMQLISCGGQVACDGPANVIATATETTATVAFVAEPGAHEVAIAEIWDDATVTPISVSDTFYTFSGLTASTTYTIGVRNVCSPTNMSDWVLTTVTTDEHPCATPSALTVSDVTLTSATLGWTIGEAETQWELHVTGTNYDEIFTVTTNPYTVTGLTPAVTYSFTVSAICSETQTSEPSEAQAFTTASCQPVSGVTVSNVTTNSAQVSWTAVQGVNGYEVEYGASGFNQGAGTTVQASTNSASLTGLTSNMPYDVYVRSVCAEGVYSAWSNVTSFTTHEGEGIDDVNSAAIALYPNPATTTVTISGISGQATVTIVDMNGRVNGEWKVENDEITIDLTGYAQGAYFVRITGEQQNAIRKLIVK